MESSFVPNYDKIDHIAFTLKKKVENKRLDQYLSCNFPEYTRSFISKLIKDGHVTVNGKIVKPSAKIRSENQICICLPQLEPLQLKPESIPLDILYEDEWLAAINKQPDLVEQVGNRSFRTQVTAVLGKSMTNLTDGPVAVIGCTFHQYGDPTRGITFIADFFIGHAI